MATRYVGPGGTDSGNATSYVTRWLTMAYALGATSALASGDTLWVSPGIYREVVSCGGTYASTVNIWGDVTGANTDGIGGPCTITNFTTNDQTAVTATTTLNLNGKSFMNFQNLRIISGGATAAVTATVATSHDITFKFNLLFSMGATAISHTTGANVVANWTIDSNILVGLSAASFTFTRPSGADLNLNILIQNNHSTSLSSNGYSFTATGANTFNAGGVNILANTIEISGNSSAVITSSANLSTTIPINAYLNNIVAKAGTGFTANTLGQVIEDKNQVWVNTYSTFVTQGANSKVVGSSWATGLEFGQSKLQGFKSRPFNSPDEPGSNLLNFNFQAGNPALDIFAAPRSTNTSGAMMAAGAYEFVNAGQYSTALHDAGSASVLIPGFGYDDFYLAIDNTQTTVSVKVQTASYGGTTYPQLQVIGPDGTVLGTANATVASSSGWETISVTFTLSAALSQVIVRLISQSNTTAGSASFDTTGVV